MKEKRPEDGFLLAEYAFEKLVNSPYQKHDLMSHTDMGIQPDINCYVDYFECFGYEKFVKSACEFIDNTIDPASLRFTQCAIAMSESEGWQRIPEAER